MTPQELKAAREAAGKTRADLASELGITERHVYRLEGGESEINKRMALALAQLFPNGAPKVGSKVGSKRPRKNAA